MVLYADGPSATEAVDVAARASLVWALVTDPAIPARFSSELQTAHFRDSEAGPRLGAEIVGTNQLDIRGVWTTTSTVTEFEPDRRFTWVVGDLEDATARWTFQLEPLDSGTTRLAFSATMGPGPSGLLDLIDAKPELEEKIIAKRLEMWEANMRATIEGIKELAEAS